MEDKSQITKVLHKLFDADRLIAQGEWRIKVLTWLSRFFQHKKSFKSLSKQDLLQYLNTLRKPADTDPDQRWTGDNNGFDVRLGCCRCPCARLVLC